MAGPNLKFKLSLGSRKKNRDFIGVEMDEHCLRIVHLQAKGLRREFVNLVSYPIKGVPDDGLLLILRQTLEKFQIKNPRVFLMVPLPLVITRNIEIPSQEPEEIKEIVNLQASRHTPYARAEIIVDMVNLGVVRDRYSKILLVIVPKEAVNKQIQLLERSGLELEKVVFPPEAVSIVANKMVGKEFEDNTFVVVHVDHMFTSFIVVKSSKVIFVRGIHIGASQLTEERASFIDRFEDELEKSLEAYNADEVGVPPATILMLGVTDQLPDLEEILGRVLQLKVRKASYQDYFHFNEASKKEAIDAKNVSFLNLLAPTAVADRLIVDLTSEEKKLKIQLEKRVKDMFKTGVLTMIILSLVFVHVTARITFKRSYLKQITMQYLPVRENAKALEQMMVKTEAVKSYLVSRGNALRALTEAYDATPMDTRLAEIKYDEAAQKFSLKGTSMAMSSVFSYVSNLDKSPIFKNVKTKFVNTRSEEGRDVADFEINCLIEEDLAK